MRPAVVALAVVCLAATADQANPYRGLEPQLVRRKEKCARTGAVAGAGELASVTIGWRVGGSFKEQIVMCVDEAAQGTVWARHTVHGATIGNKASGGSRPSFAVDMDGKNR
jgi:hypothetical protein